MLFFFPFFFLFFGVWFLRSGVVMEDMDLWATLFLGLRRMNMLMGDSNVFLAFDF